MWRPSSHLMDSIQLGKLTISFRKILCTLTHNITEYSGSWKHFMKLRIIRAVSSDNLLQNKQRSDPLGQPEIEWWGNDVALINFGSENRGCWWEVTSASFSCIFLYGTVKVVKPCFSHLIIRLNLLHLLFCIRIISLMAQATSDEWF